MVYETIIYRFFYLSNLEGLFSGPKNACFFSIKDYHEDMKATISTTTTTTTTIA